MSVPTEVPVTWKPGSLIPEGFLNQLLAAQRMAVSDIIRVLGNVAGIPLIDPVTGKEVLPGTIGLTSISGEAGKLIRLGQWLVSNPVRRWLKRNTEPNLQHAFVYLGGGEIVQAEPGGATIVPVSTYSSIYWCTGIASRFTQEELSWAADSARGYKGVKYSFLDYLYIAIHRLHIPVPGLRAEISDSGHMICSQLADEAYAENGLHVFSDGRWPGDVMPMDLYFADQEARADKK